MMESENGNQNGQVNQKPADGQGNPAEARPYENGNASEGAGASEAQVRADASRGQDAGQAHAAVNDADPTSEEFEAYVNGELGDMAAKLGYRVSIEKVSVAELWPAWYYPKGSSDGVVCQSEEDIPEGYVRRPFE